MAQQYYSVAFDGMPTMAGSAELISTMPQNAGEMPRFEDEQLLSSVRRLSPGSYLLLQPEFSGLNVSALSCQFIENQSLGRGREESRRGTSDRKLRFGQLLLKSPADYEACELVAVKPFEAAREAVHEYLVTAYMNSAHTPTRDFSSFRPLGFYAYENAIGTALITEYDESVISYDNLFWNPDREPARAEAEKAIGYMALTLAHLHELAISFGDAQVKNFAADSKGPRHIDLESAKSLVNHQGRVDFLEASRQLRNNVASLFRSLSYYESDDYSGLIEDKFIPTYLQAADTANSRIPLEGRLTERDCRELLIA